MPECVYCPAAPENNYLTDVQLGRHMLEVHPSQVDTGLSGVAKAMDDMVNTLERQNHDRVRDVAVSLTCAYIAQPEGEIHTPEQVIEMYRWFLYHLMDSEAQ